MFQPQPTPFAASCFNSYGAADLSFPLTLQALPGASSANPPPAAPPDAARSRQQHQQQQQQPRQQHHHNQHSVPHQLQHQHQHHGHHNHNPNHHAHPQQSLLYSASTSASPVAAQFSPAPSHGLGSPFDEARMEQQQQRQQETTGLMGDEMAAQEAAAREYQPRLEVRNCRSLLSSRHVFMWSGVD